MNCVNCKCMVESTILVVESLFNALSYKTYDHFVSSLVIICPRNHGESTELKIIIGTRSLRQIVMHLRWLEDFSKTICKPSKG